MGRGARTGMTCRVRLACRSEPRIVLYMDSVTCMAALHCYMFLDHSLLGFCIPSGTSTLVTERLSLG